MPDLLSLTVTLSGGLLGYGDAMWIGTLILCLLLLVAACELQIAGPASKARRMPVVLFLVIGLSLAIGLIT